MLPNGRSILLVDDSPDDRFLMLQACKGAGIAHRIVEAADGQEAVEILDAFRPDADGRAPGLVLLDIKMPRKNGMETLAWIRSSPRWRVLPVLIMSASTLPKDVEEAYRLGATAFVAKPPTIQELVELAACIKSFWLRFNEFTN